MERQERKIMVEVTQEEYERIKAGALEKRIPTYEEIKQDLLKNLSEQDIKLLLEKHSVTILSNVIDEKLVGEIVCRTKARSNIEKEIIRDARSGRDSVILKGVLMNLKKKEYSKIDEPIVETNDTFTWILKTEE